MKTLIELFDESPILNVLASVAFKPEKLIFFGADPAKVQESREDSGQTDCNNVCSGNCSACDIEHK